MINAKARALVAAVAQEAVRVGRAGMAVEASKARNRLERPGRRHLAHRLLAEEVGRRTVARCLCDAMVEMIVGPRPDVKELAKRLVEEGVKLGVFEVCHENENETGAARPTPGDLWGAGAPDPRIALQDAQRALVVALEASP